MLFKKKPKSPFEEIMAKAISINDDLMAFVKDKNYTPTTSDFNTLSLLLERLNEGCAIAGYTNKRLRQRQEGKPEESDKFTDNDKFNWHNP